MSHKAWIGYIRKDGTIKCVFVHNDGDIENLGQHLINYYTDISNVKDLVKGEIDYVNEDEFERYAGDEDDYLNYEDATELAKDMNTTDYYYLFDLKETWHVSKPNHFKFYDLETVIEEEC